MSKIDKIQLGDTIYNLGVKAENIDGKVPVDLDNYYNKQETDGIIQRIDDKIKDIELFKFPNAIIHGTPTINNGQVNDFSNENYLSLPAIFDLHDRGFEFNFAFRTGSDVATAQNIIGSKYCMALFIQNSKINLRVSQNGSDWGLVDIQGNIDIQPNTIYYVQISFDKLTYKLKYSLDGQSYTEIASKVASVSPHPAQIYLGVGNNFHNPFKGIINLNKCYLKINNSVIWQGMDDAGLATRADIDLSNITETAEERIKEIAGGSGGEEYYDVTLSTYFQNSNGNYSYLNENDINQINALKEHLAGSDKTTHVRVYTTFRYAKTLLCEIDFEAGKTFNGDYEPIFTGGIYAEPFNTTNSNYDNTDSTNVSEQWSLNIMITHTGMYVCSELWTSNNIRGDRYATISKQHAYTELPLGIAEPTDDRHFVNKKYVDERIVDAYSKEYIDKLPQKTIDEGFDYITESEIELNYNVENPTPSRGFELNSNGYYESNTKGIGDSCALAKINFNLDDEAEITIDYICNGENNWDYGMFSVVDGVFEQTTWEDAENLIYKNCKGESSPDVKQLTYKIPAGEHFIYVKYIKDSGGDVEQDSLQFKVNATAKTTSHSIKHLVTKEYVDEKSPSGGTFNTMYYAKNTMLRYYSLGSAVTTWIDENDIAEYNQACLEAGQFIPMAVRFSVLPNRYAILFPTVNPWGGFTISGGYIEQNGVVTRITINGDVIDNAEVGNLPQFNFWYIANGFNSDNYYTKTDIDNKIGNVESLLSEV